MVYHAALNLNLAHSINLTSQQRWLLSEARDVLSADNYWPIGSDWETKRYPYLTDMLVHLPTVIDGKRGHTLAEYY